MWLVPFEVFPFALGHFGFNQFPVGMRRSPQHPSGFQVVLQRIFALVPTVPAVSPVRDSDRTSRPGLNPALEGSLASVFVPLNYRVEVVSTQPLRTQGIFVEAQEVATGLWVVRIAGFRNWVLALSCTLSFALGTFGASRACRRLPCRSPGAVPIGLALFPFSSTPFGRLWRLCLTFSETSLQNPSSGTWLPRPQQGSSA